MTPRRLLAMLGAVVVTIAIAVVLSQGSAPTVTSSATPARKLPSREAAVRTATRFLAGMDARTLLDANARAAFVARWASRRTEPSLQRLYDAEAARLAPLRGGYSRAAMVGYRVDHLGAGAADVTIWAVSLASVGDLPAAVGWRTIAVGLVRDGSAWKVARVREVPGPTPESRPAELRMRAQRFEEYSLAP